MHTQKMNIPNTKDAFYRLLNQLTASDLTYFIVRWGSSSIFATREIYAAELFHSSYPHNSPSFDVDGPYFTGGERTYRGWYFNSGSAEISWGDYIETVLQAHDKTKHSTITIQTDKNITMTDE